MLTCFFKTTPFWLFKKLKIILAIFLFYIYVLKDTILEILTLLFAARVNLVTKNKLYHKKSVLYRLKSEKLKLKKIEIEMLLTAENLISENVDQNATHFFELGLRS